VKRQDYYCRQEPGKQPTSPDLPAKQKQQEKREHQVELFLDGQRPGMCETAKREKVQGSNPVGDIAQDRGDCLFRIPEAGAMEDSQAVQLNDEQKRSERWQQPESAPKIKVAQADIRIAPPFLQEDARDQEATEYEENVHPKRSAAEARQIGVEGHYDEHRYRSQTVEGRPISQPNQVTHFLHARV
jgi:hypothetical protein